MKSKRPKKQKNKQGGSKNGTGGASKFRDLDFSIGEESTQEFEEVQIMGLGSFVHNLSDEPIDPSDCDRWPASPLCGGNGIGLQYLMPAIIPEEIATDGCQVILTFGYQFGGLKGPNFSLGYKLPHCEIKKPEEPKPPEPEDPEDPESSLRLPPPPPPNTFCPVVFYQLGAEGVSSVLGTEFRIDPNYYDMITELPGIPSPSNGYYLSTVSFRGRNPRVALTPIWDPTIKRNTYLDTYSYLQPRPDIRPGIAYLISLIYVVPRSKFHLIRYLPTASSLNRIFIYHRQYNGTNSLVADTGNGFKYQLTYWGDNGCRPKLKIPHPRGDNMDKECCAAIMDAIAKLSEQIDEQTITFETKINDQTKALEFKIDEQTKIIEKQSQILQRLFELLNFKEIRTPQQWEDPALTGQIAKTSYPELFGVLFKLLNRFREIVLPDSIWPVKVPKSLIAPLGDPEKEEQLAHYPALIEAFWRWGDRVVGNPIRGIKIQNRNPQNGGPKYKEVVYMSISHMLQEMLQQATDTNGDLDWTANAVLRIGHETVHTHREAAQAAEQCREILDALGVKTGERHIEISSFLNLTEATKQALNEKREDAYETILPTLLQEKKEKAKIVDFSGDANKTILGKLDTLQRYVDAIAGSTTTEWDGTGTGLAALAGGAGLLIALKSYLRRKDIREVLSGGHQTLDDWIDEFEDGYPSALGKRGEHAQPGQPFGESRSNRPKIIEVDGK